MLFDFILIGAGPTAVAALTALPLGKKVLVATGANCRLGGSRTKSVHAKIASVARESGEEIGIGERISFAAPTKGELLRPAIVGGLANYWGQQFARYEANDPWPRKTFDSYEQYLQTCGKMEKLFDCSPGPDGGGMVPLDAGYSHRTPNLVLGCAGGRRLGLMSMRAAFNTQASAHDATVVHLSAVKWETQGTGVRVVMSDGSSADGRVLLLAAGVVGTLNVLFASCSEVRSATFGDHSPSMLYTTLKPGALPSVRMDGEKHFNALAIEKIIHDEVRLFASLYRLSHAPLSLLLAMLKLPALARGVNIPGLMNIMTPIQVWTGATQMRYRLERDSREAFVETAADSAEDVEMTGFLQWIKQRARVWKIADPAPGGGFHFCAARVRTADGELATLDDYLHKTQRGKVVVVDASALPDLGCRPSALTMMANSHRQVERCVQN